MATTDTYSATAGAYDLFSAPVRGIHEAVLDQWLPLTRPDVGPLLDIGAGSGANTVHILRHSPHAELCALEPSQAMRGLALSRLAAYPQWHDRVTLWPDDFFSAELPERIGGALALGVIGHFDPGERQALLAELAARLPQGAPLVVDLQAPSEPGRVAPYEFTAAKIGEITYRCIAEAWPLEGERMRWRMSYVSLRGDRILTEDITEHIYHHPSPAVFAGEAREAGFTARELDQESFRLLIRD